ncbi:hypothetical protein SAMN06265222_101188 [Neorhodopirellula lusitana]|uniref:Uncharacterized protein n=1 Tax=Neorhodopirellula lusitana TaxID=445327 RepID=A0ABY1PQ45_9BACT|nr:hypothetical protein [Neorhodopirellula lusitana]SMP38780.1 hypothetical protein SAMN06265222_101188 [Neorhodopirellula lusitana]
MNTDFDDDEFEEEDSDLAGDEDYDDEEDYQDFLRREFPDQYAGGSSGGNSLPSLWKWTTWGMLALLAIFWLLSIL